MVEHHGGNDFAQFVQALILQRADEHSLHSNAIDLEDIRDDPGALGFGQFVALVVDQDLGNALCTDLCQHPGDFPHLLVECRAGGVHHMQQEVRLCGLQERGFEGFDEFVGQVTNEAYRIRQGYRTLDVLEVELTSGGVKRSEELVCRKGSGFHQSVEQGGLARVGVAHQGDAESLVTLALTALGAALLLELFQARFERLDTL